MSGHWTDAKKAELKRLIEDNSGATNGEIATLLGPEFDRAMVAGQRFRMGLSRDPELTRRTQAIGAKITAAKFKGRTRGGIWTKADPILRANAGRLMTAQIAALVGKSEKAVERRAARLGIKLSAEHHVVGSFNFRVMPKGSSPIGGADSDLIRKHLEEKGVTACPPMPAAGAVVPSYIGKTGMAA